MWTILTADSGTSSPHRSSTSRSTETVRPALQRQPGQQRARLAPAEPQRLAVAVDDFEWPSSRNPWPSARSYPPPVLPGVYRAVYRQLASAWFTASA